MKSAFLTLVSVGAMAFTAAAPAQAVVTYIGADDNVTSLAQMTNSVAAAALFDAATLGSSLITFESPLPTGVSITGGNGITNNSGCGAVCGINTTPGGEFFLSMFGGSATFNFTTPIEFFGAYLTGLQTDAVSQQTVTFTDGSAQSINFPSAVNGGGAFIGFTDFGKSISSVTINATGDIITVDDVRFGTTVPEPASWALMIAGFGLTGAAMRRRKAAVAA